MTLIEGIKLVGKPALIKGCTRSMLPELFKNLGYKVGAEIGVHRGIFTEEFCVEGLKMYAIDPWIAYSGSGRTLHKQSVQDVIYQEAKERLVCYGDMAIILRKTSMDALSDIKDGSLDFVYLDGNHELPFAIADIYWWSNKVRKGGVVSGHDYFNSGNISNSNVRVHVKAAVDAYVQLAGIENWWVIAHLSHKERKNKNDKCPSWMWFKS